MTSDMHSEVQETNELQDHDQNLVARCHRVHIQYSVLSLHETG